MFIIAELHWNLELQGWYSDNFNTAAIWVMDRTKLQLTKAGERDDFVWVKIKNITYTSVYLSPNQGIAVFWQKLEDIEELVRRVDAEVVLAGDFNTKALDWGMDYTCSRGSVVVEMSGYILKGWQPGYGNWHNLRYTQKFVRNSWVESPRGVQWQ